MKKTNPRIEVYTANEMSKSEFVAMVAWGSYITHGVHIRSEYASDYRKGMFPEAIEAVRTHGRKLAAMLQVEFVDITERRT